MADIIQERRDTAANWTSVNPVLHQGEKGYETDTGKEKLGDGSTAWASLGYLNDHIFSGTTKIYTKLITGTWPASGNAVVAHGLTVANIIAINAVVFTASDAVIPENHTINANLDFQAYIVSTNVYLVPISGTALFSKPYKIVLTYTN